MCKIRYKTLISYHDGTISDQSISSLPSTYFKGQAPNFSRIIIDIKKEQKCYISPHDSRVDDVGSVGGADDEHVLLAAHSVHLCQDLVDHL